MKKIRAWCVGHQICCQDEDCEVHELSITDDARVASFIAGDAVSALHWLCLNPNIRSRVVTKENLLRYLDFTRTSLMAAKMMME